MRLFPLALALIAGCGRSDEPTEGRSAFAVQTTFYPLEYFAERIAGGFVAVHRALPDGEDPATWRPDATTLARVQEADLILANGAGFEAWIPTVSLPPSRLVETAAAFRDEWIEVSGGAVHSHGKGGKHSHEGFDGHTWLDPVNAKRQARAVLDALVKVLPADAGDMEARYDGLAKDLDALDAAFRALPPLPPMIASHAAYDYLARRYGWKIESLDLDPDEAPTDDQVTAILASAKAHGASHILWESEPLPATVERLRPLVPVVFSPVESRPGGDDYLGAMYANLSRLKELR